MEIGAKGDLEFAVNAIFDRVANAPKGREGGGDGRGRPGRAEDAGTTLRTKGFQVIPKGDRLMLKLPGGGGMGDPQRSATRRWSLATCAMAWCPLPWRARSIR